MVGFFEFEKTLDDFATNHMVFVAHSMGGLLIKALAVNSESRMWDAAFLTPVAVFAKVCPYSNGTISCSTVGISSATVG